MPDFPTMKNDLLLRAARGEQTERTPVWVMRQAGRYLPEYRALREQHSFFDMVRAPELAAEVTLQPIERFPLDGAIIFSDILVVPQVMGLEVQMVPGRGPVFPEPLQGPADLARLRQPDVPADLSYVYEALTLVRRRLDGRATLLGFSGAPWTLMAYMIEGGGSKNFSQAKTWLFRHQKASHALLQRITDVVVQYLAAQIEAGAQVVQVFDSWAGLLGPVEFRTYILPYLRQIAQRVQEMHPDVPLIVFAKGAHYGLEAIADIGYQVVALDWTQDARLARQAVGEQVTLQGNMDPCALYAQPDDLRMEVRQMLVSFGTGPHIANLGHGMHPDHDPENVRVFLDAVREISTEMRSEVTA